MRKIAYQSYLLAASAGIFVFGFNAQADLPTGSLPTAPTQQEAEEEGDDETIPEWVRELSNLSPESRSAYTEAFQAAKRAYAAGRMVECEGHLNTCEMYTTSNPNVWNLRASALISQARYEEAQQHLDKVLSNDSQDSVARLSLSLLQLGMHRYEECIATTDELLDMIRYKEMDQLTYSLTFRKLLCFVMLGRMDEARELVADYSPMLDAPLYYYSQAVFLYMEGDRKAALRELTTADSIFRGTGYLSGYRQALNISGITDVPEQE